MSLPTSWKISRERKTIQPVTNATEMRTQPTFWNSPFTVDYHTWNLARYTPSSLRIWSLSAGWRPRTQSPSSWQPHRQTNRQLRVMGDKSAADSLETTCYRLPQIRTQSLIPRQTITPQTRQTANFKWTHAHVWRAHYHTSRNRMDTRKQHKLTGWVFDQGYQCVNLPLVLSTLTALLSGSGLSSDE